MRIAQRCRITQPLPQPEPRPPQTNTSRTDPVPTRSQTQTIVVPKTQIDMSTSPTHTSDALGKIDDTLITIPGSASDSNVIAPPARPAPTIAVSPRTNPGSWITQSDYRTRWIAEGLSGTAGFTLKVDARGRVSDCTITGSTGHAVLDGATCRLLTRRARFNPARDSGGGKISGRYSGTISWEIPC